MDSQPKVHKARFFLSVGLWEMFFRFRVAGEKKKENDQLTGSFSEPFFFFFFRAFFFCFFDISRTNSKASKVNQHSVLNL